MIVLFFSTLNLLIFQATGDFSEWKILEEWKEKVFLSSLTPRSNSKWIYQQIYIGFDCFAGILYQNLDRYWTKWKIWVAKFWSYISDLNIQVVQVGMLWTGRRGSWNYRGKAYPLRLSATPIFPSLPYSKINYPSPSPKRNQKSCSRPLTRWWDQ